MNPWGKQCKPRDPENRYDYGLAEFPAFRFGSLLLALGLNDYRWHTRRSRAHILTACATAIHGKGDVTGLSRFPDYSVIPGNPSTENPGQKS